MIVGFGSPTTLHSIIILDPSSDCLVTGLSVNVGLKPPSGTGASSPTFKNALQPKFLCIIFTKHMINNIDTQ